jgi:hypothetical protein
MNMRIFFAAATLAGTLAAACGAGPAGNGFEPAPDLARLVCGEDAARVLTERVQARPDGLHLEITNETAGEVHVTLERNPSEAVGAAGAPGTSTHVLTIGPGTWTVTCYADGGSLQPGAFELVDTGIWVSTRLSDCETPQAEHGDPPRPIRPKEGELAEVARRALESSVDLEPGYVLERAGYPEQAEAVFRARSGERVVATMSFYPDDSGGWLEGDAAECGDFEGSNPEPADG